MQKIWHQNDLKCFRYVAKLQKWSNYKELHRFDVRTIKTFDLGRKTTKVIKLQWIASILHKNNRIVELRIKTFKTTQNYKSDQITMNCIDFTSKRSKMFSYVAKLQNDQIIVHFIDLTSKRSKQRKTTKDLFRWICIDLTWKRSKQHKTTNWSNYNALHRFDVKTI